MSKYIVPKQFCVKHDEGWCICTVDADVNAQTLCDGTVKYPRGFDVRVPDCTKCLESLKAQRETSIVEVG